MLIRFRLGRPLSKKYQRRFLSFQVCEGDFKVLDDCVKKIVKDKQPFERLTMKKKDLLEMFKYNEFKLRILNEKVGEETTVYRCGPLIDLCRGPHVRHTGKVKAMAITKNSATYWEGNSEAESLQRIYGISFPDNKLLKVRNFFIIFRNVRKTVTRDFFTKVDKSEPIDVKLLFTNDDFFSRDIEEVDSNMQL